MSISPWTRHSFAFSLRSFFGLIAAIFFFPIGSIASFAQATNFEVGTTAQRQNVLRLGVNLAGQNFYDSGQMMRNLIHRNPGFEGQALQSALQCVAVTASSCTDQNPWNLWSANFLAGATFEVVNGSAQGETGTISGNTISDYAAGNSTNPTQGITVNFSSPLSTPLAVGDFIIVRRQQSGDATAGWWTNTGGGGALSTDTTDIAPDSPGKQALEISAAGTGQSAGVTSYFDTWAGRSFIQLNGTYTLTFKAKGLGGSNQLSVSVARLTSAYGNVQYLNQNVNLSGQWEDYSYTFTAHEDGTYIGPAQVVFSAAGASLYLDDVALTEAAAPDNPTAYRNAVVDRLRQLRPGVIRLMTSLDVGSTMDNELAVPFARMPANYDSEATEQDDIPMGLHEFLVLCQAVGAEPWFTMSGETSPTDMQHLIEYLAGDASTPYGQIRASLGQSQPWTTVFPVIHLELGNEMWNPSGMPGEEINDTVAYGQRTKAVFSAARSSPYYNPSSFDLVMSGWAAVPWWTQQEMLNSSGYDSVDAAPYIFNTLSDYSSNEAIFGPMFAQPEEIDSTSGGYMAQQLQVASGGNPPANLEIYETNMGTVSGTAPQDVVNQVVGSVGAGIAVADHMLLMMRDLGITVQNLFALSEYQNTFTNTATGGSEASPLWGTVIDMGGETNVSRPTFLAEALANSAIMPTMLSVNVTGANPTWNQPLSANDTVIPIQLANAHYLQSFAFTDGTHYSIIVFNLSRSGSLPITFSGASAPTGNVLVSQLTSKNPTDNNEGLTSDSPVVSTTQSNVTNFNPATPYSLPPYSMTVFQWPNASLPPTTTTLGANPVSVDAGGQVTFTATVTSQSGSNTPTGTVSFMNGTTTLGTATLNSSGVGIFSTTVLPAGTNSITASYGGDSNDAGSVSSAVTVTVTSNAVPTTTTLAASPTAANTGQSVTLTATVAPQSGSTVPQGAVTFLNGTSSLGSATLNASGVATLSITSLPAGADSLTASYAGNTNDAASVSPAVTVNITQTVLTTTTALTASATQIAPGQSVTLMAAVTPQSGSTPTGTITFLNGTTVLGTATLNSSGAASFSTSSLPNGANSITASYGGSTSDSASVSPAVTITVAQGTVATATTLTPSATSVSTGQSITFTAKVAPQSGTTIPSGTVAFLNGASILGTAVLDSSGVAAFSTTALPAGSDLITASYGGTTGFNSSVSTAATITVQQTLTATTTILALSATQIIAGQSLTLTATVTPQSGSTPSGSVTFLDGTTTLGTVQLSGGVASFSTPSLSAGTHSITASYVGSTANSASSSTSHSVQVAPAPVHTTTSLSASPNAINSGQSVTFTATVTPETGGGAVPILPVAFLDGSTIIGTANVNSSGVATFTTTALSAGPHSITASYTGNTADLSSVSTPVVVQVTQTIAATTTMLAESASQIDSGGNVVFTATVLAASGGATPTGTVTFVDGSATLGTAALNGSGTAFFSTSQLSVGTHQVTASYDGSPSDSKSVSAPLTVTVIQSIQPTSTTLAASSTQVAYGTNVTLTATVSQQTGGVVSTGSVAFLDGSTILATVPLSASGAAVLNTRTLAIGTHSIVASFVGSAGDSSSSSAPVPVIIIPSQGSSQSATTIFLTASATQITSGQSVTFTATLVSDSGNYSLSGNVTFLDGSNVFGAAGIEGNGSASFTTSALSSGTHSITAVYGGNDETEGAVSSPVTVVVQQALAALPAPVLAATVTTLASSTSQVTAGDPLTLTATVADQTGGGVPGGTVQFLDGSALLGAASLSSGDTATFTTSSLSVGTHSITAAYQGDTSNGASTSPAVSVVVAAAGTPGYTMTVSSSDVSVKPGEVANLTVTVTPENGFNKPLNLTCSSPLQGTTCSFSPPTVTPNGGPATSTLSILVASSSTASAAENQTPPAPFDHRMALGMVMPWGIFSLLGLSRRKNRSRAKVWSIRVIVALALTAGSLWISGCGYHTNSSNFTMTLTSSGVNVPTHTSQIIVNVLQ